MTPEARARLWQVVQRGQAAIDRAREQQAATMRGLTVIRRALAPGQAERRLQKFYMGVR